MKLKVKFSVLDSKFDAKLSGEDALSLGGAFSECVVVPAEVVPEYEGSYEVTPKVDAQILPTAEKKMTDNVTVKAIPYFDVSNPAGGKTIFIGSEV